MFSRKITNGLDHALRLKRDKKHRPFLNNVCISLISEMVNKQLLNRFFDRIGKIKKTIFFQQKYFTDGIISITEIFY